MRTGIATFRTVLAFDWDASGLTTTTTGALKGALRRIERTLGIFVAGGKDKTSLKTPEDIESFSQRFSLIENDSENLSIWQMKNNQEILRNLLEFMG